MDKPFSAFLITLMFAVSYQVNAQPLPIGIKAEIVDSCLQDWGAKPQPSEQGDSSCLGVKFWNIDGHMVYHMDTTTQRLTKVDWLTYTTIGRSHIDSIAKDLARSLGMPSRAKDENGIYWIWDNEEIHYMLGYDQGVVRLLEFEDQSSLNGCSLIGR